MWCIWHWCWRPTRIKRVASKINTHDHDMLFDYQTLFKIQVAYALHEQLEIGDTIVIKLLVDETTRYHDCTIIEKSDHFLMVGVDSDISEIKDMGYIKQL